jgi:hypothetical protein
MLTMETTGTMAAKLLERFVTYAVIAVLAIAGYLWLIGVADVPQVLALAGLYGYVLMDMHRRGHTGPAFFGSLLFAAYGGVWLIPFTHQGH